MNFDMKLDPTSFDRIYSGIKTTELRLFDEKRRQIKIDDTITFSKLPDLEDYLSVKVISLETFQSFDEFGTEENLNKLGTPNRTKEQFLKDIHQTYSEEREKEFGVLAIGIKLI